MIPQGWQEKRLWEVTDWDKRFQSITNGKQRKILSFNHILAETMKTISVDNGDIKLLATGKFDGYTTEKLAGDNLNEGEVLTLPSGGTASIKYYNGKFVDSGNIIAQSTDTKRYYLKYIYYYLISINDFVASKYKGASIKHPYMPEILEITIPLPPLPEQERIVAKLDKAFEAIDKVKANAEQNLNNAKELFESALNKALLKSETANIKTTFGKEFKIKSGDFLSSQHMEVGGKYNVYGGNGVNGNYNHYNCSGENIIIGRVGEKCGNVHYVNEDVWVTDNAFILTQTEHPLDKKFLYYLLTKLNLRKYAAKSTHPVISGKSMKDVLVYFPDNINTQQKIVEKLDALQEQTKQLEQIYTKKIKECDELKQSILQKAFRGEL